MCNRVQADLQVKQRRFMYTLYFTALVTTVPLDESQKPLSRQEGRSSTLRSYRHR